MRGDLRSRSIADTKQAFARSFRSITQTFYCPHSICDQVHCFISVPEHSKLRQKD